MRLMVRIKKEWRTFVRIHDPVKKIIHGVHHRELFTVIMVVKTFVEHCL
jgi:hypothetical protein